MRFTGELKTWTEDKGFGFITPTDGGQDIFVHISEYPQGRRPALNEKLSFEVALNPQGKKKAVQVRLAEPASAGIRHDLSRTARRWTATGMAYRASGSGADSVHAIAIAIATDGCRRTPS